MILLVLSSCQLQEPSTSEEKSSQKEKSIVRVIQPEKTHSKTKTFKTYKEIKKQKPVEKIKTTTPVTKGPVKKNTTPPAKQPTKPTVTTRKSALAGSWYSADPNTLRQQIETYLNSANPEVEEIKSSFSLIIPHAGHRWSGPTAAYAYKLVQGRSYKRVVILSPSHTTAMTNAAIPSVQFFKTPLGSIPIDTELIKILKNKPGFVIDDRPHAKEHAIEIHLPFLQVALKPDFKLLPVVIGHIDAETAKTLAQTLKEHLGPDDLIIASSDFTHYGKRFDYLPFSLDNPELAKKIRELDMGSLEAIRKLSATDLYNYRQKTGITLCGIAPIMVLLELLPKDTKATLLHYDTSGAQTQNYQNSVSYLSVLMTLPPKSEPEIIQVGGPEVLSHEQQRQALIVARGVLDEVVTKGNIKSSEDFDLEFTGPFLEHYGVFVTLKKGERLRGCIGNIFPRMSLIEGIMGRTVDAALHDRRFTPVLPEELKEIEVEISVLTKPHEVESYEDIIIGTHGVVLYKNRNNAVFLPQVAPEQGWDLEETLSHLASKAGLPSDGWKENTRFEVFEAQVFKEAHHK